MGISKQADGACLPLLNTYIVGLMAAHFTTYSWPEYIYIYISSFVGHVHVSSYLLLLGSDIPNEFAFLCVHYLFPYVFLIYALGHKVEVDWKKNAENLHKRTMLTRGRKQAHLFINQFIPVRRLWQPRKKKIL